MAERKLGIIHRKGSEAGEEQRLGPYAIEALIGRDEEGGLTAYRVVVEARERTSESYHKVAEELYFVLGGRGVATLDGERYPLSAGDFLRLPPGTRHRFETGEERLEMLNVHSPGSRPDRDVYFTDHTPEGFSS